MSFARWTTSIFLALALAFALACGHAYKPLKASGGYLDIPVGDGRYEVSFSGDGSIPEQRMDAYLLYRCAQLTLDLGKPYFVVEDRTNDPADGRNFYAQYRRVRIRVEDAKPSAGDWYEAQAIKSQLSSYVDGPYK